ncbi:MAG: adenylate/guanylate cyclase domain-containing protein [Pseudomonadota bacterium]
MTFDELLDRVEALVNERGRVALAAVREYFDLSPERLDAVRDELVDARAAVGLENGRILVSRASANTRSDDVRADAERRHITVMFADLAGSTDLSSRLDPEDLRAVVQRYQRIVAHAVERFHGFIAQYLGDGVLVYFGYPHAHEDDARRALFAAHDVLERLPALNTTLGDEFDVEISLRIGVHTGLVVVGDIGAGSRREALALGEVPNVAARLESIAPVNSVALSDQTRVLLGDQFKIQSLGQRALKGLPGPVPVFQSLGPSGVSSAFDLAVKHKLLPLAGRRDELAVLEQAWERAQRGEGGAVLVSGDPGIGKSRLIQALKDNLTDADQRWTALRASAYFSNSPLYPVVTLLRQTIGIDRRDPDAVNYARIEASLAALEARGPAVNLIATLCDVALPEGQPPVDVARATAIFGDLFMDFLVREPRLLVVEDVHWLDPTTLSLTASMIERAVRESLLVVVSARPGFDIERLGAQAAPLIQLRLGPLPRDAAHDMIRSVANEQRLDATVLDAIVERTDGVPAFVEELSRMLLASDWLVEKDGVLVPGGELPSDIPVTLTDSLMARLDRLGDAKAVALEASVVGRTFPGELLMAVSEFDSARVDRALRDLEQAQVIRRRTGSEGNTWRFRHALLQEAAYESVLRSKRQALHLAIATALETEFQSLAEQYPERVAQHFEYGGDAERALGYRQWAGEQAVERGAPIEAFGQAEHAMSLLEHLPPSEIRDQRELSLLSLKGSALILRQGWAAPGLAAVYDRSLALIAGGEPTAHVDYQVLGGLCAFHLLRGEFDTVMLLTERLMQQGRQQGDDPSMTVAHVCRCLASFSGGDFEKARRESQQVLALHDPARVIQVGFLYGQDPVVISQSIVALMTFAEGDTDEALMISDRVRASARQLPGRFSALWADAWHARLLYETGQTRASTKLAQDTLARCEEFGIAYVGALAQLVLGVSRIADDDATNGLNDIRKAMAFHASSPSALAHNYFYALVIDAEMRAGDASRVAQLVDAALAVTHNHSEMAWRSEVLRLDGQRLVAADPPSARARFEQAVGEATRMGAHRLALRAAIDWCESHADPDLAAHALTNALQNIAQSKYDPDVPRARACLNR